MSIHKILEETFGYSTFRGQQEEVIQTILEGRDALVIMPTGGGKSLCYQIPALVKSGMTVVISPLIALMNDQVSALKQLDISAEALHSNIDPAGYQHIVDQIRQGVLKVLYVSPEKILTSGIIALLQSTNVSLFAIDEAHCVSVWGNDFRPEYVKLSELKKTFPQVPTMALTATADSATQKDIIEQLQLKAAQTFISSFERENITMKARPGLKRIDQIRQFLSNQSSRQGIIYCLSRKSTESVAAKLQKMGFKAQPYHAGMKAQDRLAVQRAFQNDTIDIVCATIAFGMGIDKPNIRFVIHYNMPKTIEGYYQEIGRAGRDGLPAESILFYSWGDYLNLQKFIDQGDANDTFKEVQRAKLERMWQFATAIHCRTSYILNYFGEFKNEECNHCDNCTNKPALFDGTTYTQMALSAIIRTQEGATFNQLIDVLRGANSKEIQLKGWSNIKTYGVGRMVPATHWRHFINQMINQGIIAIDYADEFKLKSTPLSKNVLQQKLSVHLAKFEPLEKKKKSISISVDTSNADEQLLSELKSWRSEEAKTLKVPAYVILHDKALKQIATLKPNSRNQLLNIDGIGKVKLEKYGDAIMDILHI